MPTESVAPVRRANFHGYAWLAPTVGALLFGGIAVAQDRTITTAVSIEQDQLAVGAYTVNQVLQSGRQFFAVPFLPADGHGEGDTANGDPANGSRAQQRADQWAGSTPFPHAIPFLRVNGIDSQSCFECHNSAGTYVPDGQLALTQKPGGLGGAGGFSVSLLSNDDFPDPLSHFLRHPPRTFGSAYLQELALEMTAALLDEEDAARAAAASHPGTPAIATLSAKGVSFGSIAITCPNATCTNPTRDTSKVVGVQPDLIVRPYQHKGIAATMRSFVKTALNFHHSMQPVEVVGANNDCDGDGLINEMAVDNAIPAAGTNSLAIQQSLGNVAALTAFTGMLRPPSRSPCDGTDCAVGEALFSQVGCASCHVPSLATRPQPKFRIQLAEPAGSCPSHNQLGSFAEAGAVVQPAVVMARAPDSECSDGSLYCIDLTNPSVTPLPGEFLPRLGASSGTRNDPVAVPLFSDLKRHKMGCFLAQAGAEQADDAGNPIPNNQWLTSKLWGVSANGPWLHDGRARTLREAILMHNGPAGTGINCGDGRSDVNEAAPVIAAFLALSKQNQNAIVDFLGTLTIPMPGG